MSIRATGRLLPVAFHLLPCCSVVSIKKLYSNPSFGFYKATILTKTRAGNAAYHRWLFNFIIVDWVDKVKSARDLPASATTVVTMDGEPIQLLPLFDRTILQDKLKEKNIVVAKSPGSTTSINQPCDVLNCFRGPKTQNKKINNKDVKDDKFMLSVLGKIFDEHNEWLNDEERGAARANGKKKKRPKKSEKPDTIAMDPSHVSMAKLGLLRVQLALQMCMRPHMIKDSFKATGIYPRSVDIVLANCHTRIPPPQVKAIKAAMPALVNLFKVQGEIYEADFDRLGIVATNPRTGKGLDSLVLYRRRAMLLTHPQVRLRELNIQYEKLKAERKRSAPVSVEEEPTKLLRAAKKAKK
jgi:hypothetical protein